MAGGMLRFPLHLRAQHGMLGLFILAALGTGLARGSGLYTAWASPAHLNYLHLWSGFGTVGLFLYHLAYFLVVGYVEGRHWDSFPLRWGLADWRATEAEFLFILGRRAERPEGEEFRSSQKALYWATFAGVAGTGATGILIAFWDRLGGLGVIGHLALIAELHRGGALLLLTALLWHLYGVFTWEGRWEPEWSWATGMLNEDKARCKLQGFYRRHLQEEAALTAAREGKNPEAIAAARRSLEKEEVQKELALGNQFALEEKFVEALYHYRRALEMYPGYSQARYNMARVLSRMGEKAMAREAYLQFLEDEPFHDLATKAREALREMDAEERQ